MASRPFATPSAVFNNATYAFTASCTSADVSVTDEASSAISELMAPIFATETPLIAASAYMDNVGAVLLPV